MNTPISSFQNIHLLNTVFYSFLIFVCCFLSSCTSYLTRQATSSSGHLFRQFKIEQEKNADFELFKRSLPQQLSLLESLIALHPDDLNLRALLVQGYSALAYSIHETYAWRDSLRLSQLPHAPIFLPRNHPLYPQLDVLLFHRKQALKNYSRSIKHFDHYLQTLGLSLKQLQKSQINLSSLLEDTEKKHFSHDQDKTFFYTTLFFGSQSLLSLAQFQKNHLPTIGFVTPSIKLINWVCEKKPDLENGLCPMSQAAYLAVIPQAFGGNTQKAKEIFREAISQYPNNYLLRVSFLEFVALLHQDLEIFEEQDLILKIKSLNFEENLIFPNNISSLQSSVHSTSNKDSNPENQLTQILYNAVALERYRIFSTFGRSYVMKK
jgi:tetratricopeptide (TPR) repeat protein